MPALRHDEPFRCTTLLTAKSSVGRRRRRRLVIGSVVFHVVVLVFLIVLSPRREPEAEAFPHFDIVFQAPMEPEPEPIPPPPEPEPKPVVLRKVEPPKPKPALAEPKAPLLVAAKVEPKPLVALPAPVARVAPERPRPARVVQKAAGFEALAPDTPRPREVPRVVSSASFGEATAAVSRTKSAPRGTAVIGSGFASGAQPQGPVAQRPRGAVMSPGFEQSVQKTGSSAKTATPGVVKQAGFGDGTVVAAPTRPRDELRQPSARLDTPVEIVSKPKPAYTEEARKLRLEGEVVVEVTFIASGQLRVLRVVEGLGHGLDEAAVAAVRQIRFTPARRDGRPVDQTATLRVVFRLA